MQKNLAVFILLIAIAIMLPVTASAQQEVRVYGGLGILPLATEDMKDIHVSDWQNYGTGPLEGRVALPLSKGETDGIALGLVLGAEYKYMGLPVILELQYAPSAANFSFLQGLVGINLRLLDNDNFSLGVAPKLGYALIQADFGKVEMLPGKTPPVITPEGTFRVDDAIKAEMAGLALQIALTGDIKFSDNAGISIQAGWNQAFVGDLEITAGDIKLKYDSPTVVKPILNTSGGNSSSEKAGVNPKATCNGMVLMVGVYYNLP